MNAVNDYYWANQMDHSCVMSWVEGRKSTNVVNPAFPYNYFTAPEPERCALIEAPGSPART